MNVYLCATLALLAALPRCSRPAPVAALPATPSTPTQPDEVLLAGGGPARQLAFPAIFEAAFRPGTTIRQDSITLRCQVAGLGQLRSETGKLVAGDPITIASASAFTQQFPRGEFAVQLALVRTAHDERVGFVRVVFDTARVARWQPAQLPGQQPLGLRDSTYHCYGVDGGLGTVLDSAANQQLTRLGQATWSQVFISAAEKPDYTGYIYRFGGHSLATFTTGLGDGCYPTYIGFTAQGNVCRLLTDFRLINW